MSSHAFVLLRTAALALASAAGLGAGACQSAHDAPAAAPPPDATALPEKPLSLFFLSDLQATLGPCGCTSNPLGGLERTAALMAQEAQSSSASVFFLGGDVFFDDVQVAEKMRDQAELKADTLAAALKQMGAVAVGVGARDFAFGAERLAALAQAAGVQPVAANVSGSAIKQTFIKEVGGVKLGFFGIVDPELMPKSVTTTAPGDASAAAVRALRAAGADYVIALAYVGPEVAVQLAQVVKGIDFVVVGADTPLRRTALAVDSTYLFAAWNQGQMLARIDLWRRPGAKKLVDVDAGRNIEAEIGTLEARMGAYRAEIKYWEVAGLLEKNAAAVKMREDKILELKGRRDAALAEKANAGGALSKVAADASAFAFRLVPVEHGVAAEPAVQKLVDAYNDKLRAVTIKASASAKVETDAQKPAYLGGTSCVSCHAEAEAFWNNTRHAHAWQTLVRDKRDFDLECVGCHTVGYDKVNGFVGVPVPEKFQNVRCENCHGAGSFHVSSEGTETKHSVQTKVPEEVCRGCHTPKHSDLFQYEKYLAQIVGPGHGQPLPHALPSEKK